VDNGSSHNGARSVDRMSQAFPNATLVHLPVHASWINQVEIYFSIVQRKVVKPQDFPDLPSLEQRLLAFQDRYNQTAAPSTGATAAKTSTTTSPASPPTRTKQHDPRRTNGGDQ
jgi:hypothetical protein